MYAIKITTNVPITEKVQNILLQTIKEADPEAECQICGSTCAMKGKNNDPEKLFYLLGAVIGGNSQNEILKLSLSYEK